MSNADNGRGPADPWWLRTGIAMGTLIVSILGVCAIGVAIVRGETDTETAQLVVTAILPLLGTWVGTVLAYYFSRDNLQAATNSVQATSTSMRQLAAAMTPLQRLRELPVREHMQPIGKVHKVQLAEGDDTGQVRIDEHLHGPMSQSQPRFERMPVLRHGGQPLYMVHLSELNKFLASPAGAGKPRADWTLQALLETAPQQGATFSKFVSVSADASVSEAKAAMEAMQGCQDVFVTDEGRVIGWLSNNRIGRLAKA